MKPITIEHERVKKLLDDNPALNINPDNVFSMLKMVLESDEGLDDIIDVVLNTDKFKVWDREKMS
jgi:hypothetical protein